ncbi:hypothetical protein LCGC14_1312400, partial [marine sediment metagenome]
KNWQEDLSEDFEIVALGMFVFFALGTWFGVWLERLDFPQ